MNEANKFNVKNIISDIRGLQLQINAKFSVLEKILHEESNCNILQVSNCTLPDLNNFAVSNFENIAEIAQRLTSGNVAHQSKTIEGLAKNNAEFIRKYYY